MELLGRILIYPARLADNLVAFVLSRTNRTPNAGFEISMALSTICMVFVTLLAHNYFSLVSYFIAIFCVVMVRLDKSERSKSEKLHTLEIYSTVWGWMAIASIIICLVSLFFVRSSMFYTQGGFIIASATLMAISSMFGLYANEDDRDNANRDKGK